MHNAKIYLEGRSVEMNWQKIKDLKMTKFQVNSNIATTGHKLKGQTKQCMIIGKWNYRCQNWVYVVLSRVKTLNGLLLTNKLKDHLAKFRLSDDLTFHVL